jgi:hypothetical protein
MPIRVAVMLGILTITAGPAHAQWWDRAFIAIG